MYPPQLCLINLAISITFVRFIVDAERKINKVFFVVSGGREGIYLLMVWVLLCELVGKLLEVMATSYGIWIRRGIKRIWTDCLLSK